MISSTLACVAEGNLRPQGFKSSARLALAEVEDARLATWNAPGVMTVVSKLKLAH